ncbi:hypothetical protein VKT23_016782 [Stygiomarasmius scandens]|uniref:Uncharacterized protein n=1 Tax=Marasmiellus scandens TaxID=2682957 RepID=A0ABR1IY35_9AGAR
MAFDFIVLLLCAIKLHLSRISSTIGTILLRDGIAYFFAAFGANLLQTIFAALTLNPVMNIIALPFALVVSVIAATTIFRHVFLLYDSFSHVSVGSGVGRQTFPGNNSTDHCDRVGGINNRLPLTQAFSNPTRISGRRSSDLTGFHMGPLKRSDLGEVTVHKMVEISVDHSNAPSAAPTVDVESMESDRHHKNEF